MPSHLIGRVVDPILGLATGVMAYFLWENDGRNAHERPAGRSLPDLVRRRWANQDPPASLYAGSDASSRSLFHIPSASHTSKPADIESASLASRSTSQIIQDAKHQAAKSKSEAGADLRAIRTAITDEWNQSNSTRS